MTEYKEAELWGYAMRLKRYCQSVQECDKCIFKNCSIDDKPCWWKLEDDEND